MFPLRTEACDRFPVVGPIGRITLWFRMEAVGGLAGGAYDFNNGIGPRIREQSATTRLLPLEC